MPLEEFAYDAIFGPNSTQAEVFAECKGMAPASGPSGGWFGGTGPSLEGLVSGRPVEFRILVLAKTRKTLPCLPQSGEGPLTPNDK